VGKCRAQCSARESLCEGLLPVGGLTDPLPADRPPPPETWRSGAPTPVGLTARAAGRGSTASCRRQWGPPGAHRRGAARRAGWLCVSRERIRAASTRSWGFHPRNAGRLPFAPGKPLTSITPNRTSKVSFSCKTLDTNAGGACSPAPCRAATTAVLRSPWSWRGRSGGRGGVRLFSSCSAPRPSLIRGIHCFGAHVAGNCCAKVSKGSVGTHAVLVLKGSWRPLPRRAGASTLPRPRVSQVAARC
jgi:hypothetical protein